MKKTIILLAALALTSCGYNIKTDSEIVRDSFQLEEAQNQLNEVKDEWNQFKDSVALIVTNDRKRLERFKDSVQFTNLSRSMCYNNNEHRHSCEIYGNSLKIETKKAVKEQTDEVNHEQTEVASN